MLYYKMDSESKPSFCQKNSVHTKFNLQIIPNCNILDTSWFHKVFNFCQPIVCTESSHIMGSWKIYLKNNLLLGYTLYQEMNSWWKPQWNQAYVKWSEVFYFWFDFLRSPFHTFLCQDFCLEKYNTSAFILGPQGLLGGL